MKCQTEPDKKIELMTWPVVLETSDGFEGFFSGFLQQLNIKCFESSNIPTPHFYGNSLIQAL